MAISKQLTQEIRAYMTRNETYPWANKLVVSKDGIWTATKDFRDNDGGEALSFYRFVRNEYLYGVAIEQWLAKKFSVKVEILENMLTETCWVSKFRVAEVEKSDSLSDNATEPAPEPAAAPTPEWASFLLDQAIATELRPTETGWVLLKSVQDLDWATLEKAGNLDDYARLFVKRQVETQFPFQIQIGATASDGQNWSIEFSAEAVSQWEMPLEPWEAYCQIAQTLGGNPETGLFKGTIRVTAEGAEAEALATRYYDIMKTFCQTCSCIWRALKNGGSSISFNVGARIETPDEMQAELTAA